jgi:ketosteroid isomerase-like protein
MEKIVRDLFQRYEALFEQGLEGRADMDEVAALYASDFVAASPAGVMSGKNDAHLRQVMVQGYAHYRETGVRAMRVRHLRISEIDASHCVAHVGWSATYARKDHSETVLDFDVHYFVQVRDGAAKVFGWVSGDEEALLKQHGII